MCISSVWLKKADASKAATLEATAKPEPAPPVQEEKKAEDKSLFFSFFKPKVRTHSNNYPNISVHDLRNDI